MPSLRHSSATLSSPRRPAITIRTFSSAEYCRRVARRMSRTAFPASSECCSAFDLISAPFAVKMSQKPSLPQSLQTVQLVLTGNTMSNPDAKDLFERSWQSPSETEKAILRAQITGAAPQSIYGIFSSAWLNEPDGKNEASIALYRECLAKDPTF